MITVQKGLSLFNRYLISLSVFFILITALVAFIYACAQTVHLWWYILSHHWRVEKVEFHFIEVIERFLTAIALLILGTGLYELFIHRLNIPQPLKVNNFHELKSNLGNVILLNMIVIFFGDLAEEDPPEALILRALAISIISAVLIWFGRTGHGTPPENHN